MGEWGILSRDGHRQKNRIAIYPDTEPAYRNTYHDTYHKIQLKQAFLKKSKKS